MVVEPCLIVTESIRLRDLMIEHGIKIQAMNDQDKPCIQASYDPVTGTAIIDLQYVSDKDLR